jgi:hypothetical protein
VAVKYGSWVDEWTLLIALEERETPSTLEESGDE